MYESPCLTSLSWLLHTIYINWYFLCSFAYLNPVCLNRFYLPHGLTVDNHDNIWITDVGAHQVIYHLLLSLHMPQVGHSNILYAISTKNVTALYVFYIFYCTFFKLTEVYRKALLLFVPHKLQTNHNLQNVPCLLV